MSLRPLVLVSLAAFALACSEGENAAPSAAGDPMAGAPDAAAATPPMTPGAADGSPFSVTHITEGSGAMPTASDVVRVNYEGKLADGTVFDSSYARNEPATFPLSGVISCWTQGVAQMKVGGAATLVCPPEMAYGPNGVPGTIPANATLTFKVELLAIESGSPAAP
ncbi:MAG TPA: FKBP-type peptidyl-prolyl cis-trans isomerase [Myxococcota bacterium]|nr:FKBP-type peptidyl-prolyl cis-trans isomerase [Myxococcota bacterium]